MSKLKLVLPLLLLTIYSLMPTSAAEVISKINEYIEEAVVVDEDGNCFPHVCIVCDHILKSQEDVRVTQNLLKKKKGVLKADGHAGVTNQLVIDSYDFQGQGKKEGMEGVLLSPGQIFGGGKEGAPNQLTVAALSATIA